MLVFGPYAVSSSGITQISGLGGYPDTRAIVVVNESPYMLHCSIAGVGVFGVEAQVSDVCLLATSFTGSMSITCSDYLDTSTQAPSYAVYIKTYGIQDNLTISLMNGGSTGYPISLGRLQSIGNTINSNTVTTQNTLQNDGSAPGTVIIESTPGTDTSPAISITNDAQIFIGNGTHAGTINDNATVFQNAPIIFSNNVGVWGTDNVGATHVMNYISTTNDYVTRLANGTWQVKDASNNLLLSYDPSNGQMLFNRSSFALLTTGGFVPLSTSTVNTHLNGSNSSTLQSGGTDVIIALSTAAVMLQPITLSGTGSLSGLSTFTGTTIAGTVNVNHGMSVVPDICLIIITTTGSSAAVGARWNTTQANVTCAISGLTFTGLAYHH
jgi:hypothetical protein